MQMLNQYNYRTNILEIEYTTRQENSASILFCVGMIVYSLEKDTCYIIGKSKYNETVENTIIDLKSVTKIKETEKQYSYYNQPYWESLYYSMFSISTEEAFDVEVEFDNIFNIERKIHQLASLRKNASIQILSEKIIYKDKISGLSDFASYLRRFGRAVKVLNPQNLKDAMMFSVERSLQRYEEEDFDDE